MLCTSQKIETSVTYICVLQCKFAIFLRYTLHWRKIVFFFVRINKCRRYSKSMKINLKFVFLRFAYLYIPINHTHLRGKWALKCAKILGWEYYSSDKIILFCTSLVFPLFFSYANLCPCPFWKNVGGTCPPPQVIQYERQYHK